MPTVVITDVAAVEADSKVDREDHIYNGEDQQEETEGIKEDKEEEEGVEESEEDAANITVRIYLIRRTNLTKHTSVLRSSPFPYILIPHSTGITS